MDAPLVSANDSNIDNDRTALNRNNNDDDGMIVTSSSNPPATMKIALGIYCVLFGIAVYMIITTCWNYPLFPFQPDNLDWNYNWLIATIFDFYGACFCFGGIVLSSEPSWIKGLAWNLLFATLGSPACCLWMILRIHSKGSIKLLVDDDTARRDV